MQCLESALIRLKEGSYLQRLFGWVGTALSADWMRPLRYSRKTMSNDAKTSQVKVCSIKTSTCLRGRKTRYSALGTEVGNGLGVTSPSVNPRAHFIASRYMR